MATVSPTFGRDAGGRLRTITWAGMVTGDTINSADLGTKGIMAALASVHIAGTFNGGTTITLTGSNTDANFVALTDNQGTAISSTAAAVWELSTGLMYLKPTIASGSADSVTVTIAVWQS